jgi:hypothetical protein
MISTSIVFKDVEDIRDRDLPHLGVVADAVERPLLVGVPYIDINEFLGSIF